MRLTETERITILMMRGYGDRVRSYEQVAHLFNDTYPEHEPVSKSTVFRTVDRFERTGSIKDESRSGRPAAATNDNKSLEVLQTVVENVHSSVRRVAQETNISKSSVHKILKTYKYHPYKLRLVQELLEDDFQKRIEFCDDMMTRFDVNNQFFTWTCFSDEATFELNGSVNRHNMRYWADENPYWMSARHTQYPQKLNVWAGILCNQIIGPFFIDGNLTAERYLNLLRNQVVPAIRNAVGDAFERVWFQQDGAPAHFGVVVREFLNQTFPNQWIGRTGTTEWPPRSPDLSPLDFFYWGYLKSKVYETKPANLNELRDRILNVSNSITAEMLTNVINSLYVRLGHCVAADGQQFEQLIK